MLTDQDADYEVIPLVNANCVTRDQLAQMFGVKRPAISKWVKAGMPRWKDGLHYSIPRCIQWREKHIHGRRDEDRIKDDDRMKEAKADIAEMARDEKMGKLVLAADVEAELIRVCRDTQQAILAVPARVAAVCAGRGARFIAQAIEAALTRALQGLIDRAATTTAKPPVAVKPGRPANKGTVRVKTKGRRGKPAARSRKAK